MTIARRQLVDVSITRWYHCMSRCVRGALLLRNESSDRKAWLEKRIEELAQIFAIGVGGFSVMDNHLCLVPGTPYLTRAGLPMRVREWRRPRQCDSGLAEGRPLSSWALVELVGRN